MKKKELGFEKAILQEKYSIQGFKFQEEEEAFKSGYEEGNTELKNQMNRLYNYGYEGKNFCIIEKYKSANEILFQCYENGKNDKKIEIRNENIKKASIIIIPTATVFLLIFFKFKKDKKKII